MPRLLSLLLSNMCVPQILWSEDSAPIPCWLFLISLDVLVGMWLERFIIVVVSLHRDFLPSSWGMYYPTMGLGDLYRHAGLFLCGACSCSFGCCR